MFPLNEKVAEINKSAVLVDSERRKSSFVQVFEKNSVSRFCVNSNLLQSASLKKRVRAQVRAFKKFRAAIIFVSQKTFRLIGKKWTAAAAVAAADASASAATSFAPLVTTAATAAASFAPLATTAATTVVAAT